MCVMFKDYLLSWPIPAGSFLRLLLDRMRTSRELRFAISSGTLLRRLVPRFSSTMFTQVPISEHLNLLLHCWTFVTKYKIDAHKSFKSEMAIRHNVYTNQISTIKMYQPTILFFVFLWISFFWRRTCTIYINVMWKVVKEIWNSQFCTNRLKYCPSIVQ